MITFILILSVLILVHEFGHFITAKSLGVKVVIFSLGFGPKLLSRKVGETEYMLCAIPFGGFIKMAGDSPEDVKGGKEEFLSRSPGHRARIIFAGPLFNYILAFLCMWMVFFLGYPRVTSTVGRVIPDMPAQAAGLRAGDKILSVDGASVAYWEDLYSKIQDKKGGTVNLEVLRGDQKLAVALTPKVKDVQNIFGKKVSASLIGIEKSSDIVKVRCGFWQAMVKGFLNLIQMTKLTIVSICYIIVGSISFQDSVTGPLGIFYITNNAAKIGISAVFHVVGMLSMSLAVFNLLPFPILDGGHIFLAGLERIRRRALPARAEEILANIGMSLLILLAVFIFFNDLVKYGFWDKALALFIKR